MGLELFVGGATGRGVILQLKDRSTMILTFIAVTLKAPRLQQQRSFANWVQLGGLRGVSQPHHSFSASVSIKQYCIDISYVFNWSVYV